MRLRPRKSQLAHTPDAYDLVLHGPRDLKRHEGPCPCSLPIRTASNKTPKVAREFHGNLKYIGRIADGLDEYTRFDLVEELELIRRTESFVSVPPYIKAQWVQPRYTCRVKCVKELRNGSLVDVELDEMLGKISR